MRNYFKIAALLGLMALAAVPASAQSGGGSSFTPGFGSAGHSSSFTTHVTGPGGLNYTGTVGANASASNTPGGADSSVTTGGQGAGTGPGLTIVSKNTDESFTKGPASISVGISTLSASEVVNGKTVPVAEDVSVAVSRATPFGSSATTAAFGVGAPSVHKH